jgi:glycosyltransferase involved in cell wall biosynthesis
VTQDAKQSAEERRTAGSRLIHTAIGLLVSILYWVSRASRLLIRRRKFEADRPAEVLLTGSFDSLAWILTFLKPLAMAQHCRNIVLVSTFPVEEFEGVTVVYPPKLLRRVLGDVPSRLLTFLWQAIRRRPLLAGGFHISINALVADLAASLSGARSMYVCVGGPIEVIDGGLWGESRFFSKLRHADKTIEQKILRTVRQFDVVATMGNKAVEFFEQNGVPSERIRIMTGGVDADHFERPAVQRDVDVVFVGRLVEIKCVEILIQATKVLLDRGVNVTTRIVGQGPQEDMLRGIAQDLGTGDHVQFAGFVSDVVGEVARAKCFVLTSRSEGLSLALIEAMLAGAVPVVADVGDLSDLVEHGVNGYLVSSRDPAEFAAFIDTLIQDDSKLAAFAQAARASALRCDVSSVAGQWDQLLESLR